MQSTTVDELVAKGFTEDSESLKQLEKSFRLPAMIGAAGFVVSLVLVMLDIVSKGFGISFALASWCFVLLTMVRMYRSRPKSRHTGKPMLKYKNRSPASGVINEVIYVCPDSKTFSRRVYLENGDG